MNPLPKTRSDKSLRFLLTLFVACLLVPQSPAQNSPPKPPSKREAREIEKALKQRLEREQAYASHQREMYVEGSVVGRHVSQVLQEWGRPTSVVEDGDGGKIYAYDNPISRQRGEFTPGYEVRDQFGNVLEQKASRDTRTTSNFVLYKDLYVNADGVIVRFDTGTRGLKGTASAGRRPLAKVKQETFALPGKSRAELAARVREFAQKKGYVLQPAARDRIVYRDFTQFGTAQECGADLWGKIRVTADIADGQVAVQIESELFSTLFGAKLIINGNDDVASENDVPFSNLQFRIPESVRKAFPEAPNDEKGRILNPLVLEKVTQFHERYLQELRAALL